MATPTSSRSAVHALVPKRTTGYWPNSSDVFFGEGVQISFALEDGGAEVEIAFCGTTNNDTPFHQVRTDLIGAVLTPDASAPIHTDAPTLTDVQFALLQEDEQGTVQRKLTLLRLKEARRDGTNVTLVFRRTKKTESFSRI